MEKAKLIIGAVKGVVTRVTGGVSTGGVSTGGVSTGGVSTGGVSTGSSGASQDSMQVGGQIDNSFFSKYKYFLKKYRYIIFLIVSSTTFYIAHKRQSLLKVAKMLKIS